jgi:hypothetical protein
VLMWEWWYDEAISIYPLQMRARRLLRRHYPSSLLFTLTPRNDDFEVFQQSQNEVSLHSYGEPSSTLVVDIE